MSSWLIIPPPLFYLALGVSALVGMLAAGLFFVLVISVHGKAGQ